MSKTLHYIKWAVNIVLGLGCWLAVSENADNLTPNIIGLGCIFLLIAINYKDNNE